MEPWNGEERRLNRLHADDIDAIIAGVSGKIHTCRFPGIEPNDLVLVVDFVKSLKEDGKERKRVIRNVTIALIVTTIAGWTLSGFLISIKDKIIAVIK